MGKSARHGESIGYIFTFWVPFQQIQVLMGLLWDDSRLVICFYGFVTVICMDLWGVQSNWQLYNYDHRWRYFELPNMWFELATSRGGWLPGSCWTLASSMYDVCSNNCNLNICFNSRPCSWSKIGYCVYNKLAIEKNNDMRRWHGLEASETEHRRCAERSCIVSMLEMDFFTRSWTIKRMGPPSHKLVYKPL